MRTGVRPDSGDVGLDVVAEVAALDRRETVPVGLRYPKSDLWSVTTSAPDRYFSSCVVGSNTLEYLAALLDSTGGNGYSFGLRIGRWSWRLGACLLWLGAAATCDGDDCKKRGNKEL